MKKIDADKLKEKIEGISYIDEEGNLVCQKDEVLDAIEEMSDGCEPTHDEVMKYCRERCLLLMTYDAFRELNSRSPIDVKPIV